MLLKKEKGKRESRNSVGFEEKERDSGRSNAKMFSKISRFIFIRKLTLMLCAFSCTYVLTSFARRFRVFPAKRMINVANNAATF